MGSYACMKIDILYLEIRYRKRWYRKKEHTKTVFAAGIKIVFFLKFFLIYILDGYILTPSWT